MNTTFIENAIDAFEGFAASLGNDVCNDENEEYVVFSGQIATDSKGNVKTYALINDKDSDELKKVLVAQAPLRTILNKGAEFFKSIVLLYKADKEEAAEAAEAEAKAQAEADETENAEIDSKINDLSSKISDINSEISSLKLRKKKTRFTKRLSFEG